MDTPQSDVTKVRITAWKPYLFLVILAVCFVLANGYWGIWKAANKAPNITVALVADLDYSKNACESAAAWHKPCLSDPADMTNEINAAFLKALRENPACSGITVVNNWDANAQWQLTLSLDVEDGKMSLPDTGWSMMMLHAEPVSTTNGFLGDNAFQTTTRICTLAHQQR